ncbi:MAG: hypothetical protein R2911_42675 [Caldilineaceae bacterium]
MDERLQRYHDGAAVAVWGAAGLGVAYGHDALLQGFHERLWSAPVFRLGELVESRLHGALPPRRLLPRSAQGLSALWGPADAGAGDCHAAGVCADCGVGGGP